MSMAYLLGEAMAKHELFGYPPARMTAKHAAYIEARHNGAEWSEGD